MVVDLRDEADHENPTRIVVVPRSNQVDLDRLEPPVRDDGSRAQLSREPERDRPRRSTGGEGSEGDARQWLEFRRERFAADSSTAWTASPSACVLEALLVAYLNIDEVIRIVREEDRPASTMERYALTEIQANAILDLRLRQLARLEEIIQGEKDALEAERDDLERTLGSAQRMKTLVVKEITEAAEAFGDDRRSILAERDEARAFAEEGCCRRSRSP